MSQETQEQPVTSGADVNAIAVKEKTAVGKIIMEFKDFMIGLANRSAKAFHDLEAGEQLALKWASGIIAVINANLTENKDLINLLLSKLFPTLSVEVIQSKLIVAANLLFKANGLIMKSPDEALTLITNYLAGYSDNNWIAATKNVVTFLFNAFFPNAAALQKVIAGMDYVYEREVKPELMLLLAA